MRGADDRATSAAGGYQVAVGLVECEDGERAGCSARTLSLAGGGNRNISRGRALITGTPHGRLRSHGVNRIDLVAGCGKLHLSLGSGRAERDGLELTLTLTLTGTAGQRKGCG